MVYVVVITNSSVSRRVFSVGQIPSRRLVAGGTGVPGRRCVGGESVWSVSSVDRLAYGT